MYMTVLKCTRASLIHRKKNLDFFNGSDMHVWLTGQQHNSRKGGKILYRVMRTKNAIYLYIQSEKKFNCNDIQDYGLSVEKEFDIDSVLDAVSVGSKVIFDAVLWPNVAGGEEKYFIHDVGKRTSWLHESFCKRGIQVLDSREYAFTDINRRTDVEEKQKYLAKNGEKAPNLVSIRCICVRGVGIVNDKKAFCDLVCNGVGKLKNYGAGLVLVKPI